MWGGVLISFVVFLVSIPGPVVGQHFQEWMTASGADVGATGSYASDLRSFIHTFPEGEPASYKSLSKVFRKVHATYLKKYEAYSGFTDLMETGAYDCLTATMLFSQIFSELHYEYTIIETNYHIFIQVKTVDGLVLLESTDRANGFVTDPSAMAKRIAGYRQLSPEPKHTSQVGYHYQCKLYQEVEAENLTGLLYFNQAVKAYNKEDWLACTKALSESFSNYPTDRALELEEILVLTLVARKDISQELRRSCMENLMPIILYRSGKVASNGMD